MDQELRELAEKIAAFIRADEQLAAAGHVNVVVEDKADAENEIAQAIGQLGVLVLVIVTGFTRKQNSGPVLAGTVRVEIRCYEHPSLNRDGTAWTAQHVTERLIRILHWRTIEGIQTPVRFVDFGRDDVPEANVTRANYVFEHSLGVAEITPVTE